MNTTPRRRLCSGLDWNQPSLHYIHPRLHNATAINDLTGFRTFRPSRIPWWPRHPHPEDGRRDR